MITCRAALKVDNPNGSTDLLEGNWIHLPMSQYKPRALYVQKSISSYHPKVIELLDTSPYPVLYLKWPSSVQQDWTTFLPALRLGTLSITDVGAAAGSLRTAAAAAADAAAGCFLWADPWPSLDWWCSCWQIEIGNFEQNILSLIWRSKRGQWS